MAKKNDGGLAFGGTRNEVTAASSQFGNGATEAVKYPGMSLRDYFAGQALTGLLAHSGQEKTFPPDIFAHSAYVLADAMLKARDQ